MKLFLIVAAFFLSSISCDNDWTITITGSWTIIAYDENCNTTCCCPLGHLTVTETSNNQTQVIPEYWSNTSLCQYLGRTSNQSAVWPYPKQVVPGHTNTSGAYNSDNEYFYSDFYNMTYNPTSSNTGVGYYTFAQDLALDQTNIPNASYASFCWLIMVKSDWNNTIIDM